MFSCFKMKGKVILKRSSFLDSEVMHHFNLIVFSLIFLFSQLLSFGIILLPKPVESKVVANARITSWPRKPLHLEFQQLMTLPSATFQEDAFILNLISQERFSQCSLLILQDRFDSSASVDRILQNVASVSPSSPYGMKSAYSIKYTFPLELGTSEAQLKEMRVKLAIRPGGNDRRKNITNVLMSRDSLPVHFPITVSNYRRKSDPCLIVILMLNDIRPEFIKQIFNMLTPVYIPITRKDEDLYIFKTNSKHHERLLLMNELPNRTKFKIAVGAEGNDNVIDGGGDATGKGSVVVKVRTVCFFCDPGGNPRLIELPVTEQNMPYSGTDYFPDFIWNLNGKLLHVSFPYIRAKIEGEPPWQGTSNAKRGNWKMLFEQFLTVKFNFTYHMFAATGKDGNYGGGGTGLQLKNGTWIGVTGDLISQKADLGIVIANTPKRIYYIDFTNSFYDVGCLTFATAQPSRIYSPAALMWPFDWGMWTGIGASTIFSIFFFFSAFKIMEIFQFGFGEKWSLSVQIQFLLSTFLEQDSPVLPASQALRSFVALWIFFTMVLTTVYRSKMVTLLAFPLLGELPKTFDELAYASDYHVGFMKHGDSAYNTLAASTDPVYMKLVAEMEIFKGFGLECLEKVVKHKYGCIAYDFAMIHLRERNLSSSETQKLVFAPARTYNIWLGLGTEGKSIYRLNFGKILSYTRQFHLADIWDKMDMYYNVRLPKLKWWQSTNQMDKTKHVDNDPENLTMKHIAGAFYVLVACLVISSVAFVEEILTFHSKRVYKGFVFRFWAVKNAAKKLKKRNNLLNPVI